jgi:hypothetical protein
VIFSWGIKADCDSTKIERNRFCAQVDACVDEGKQVIVQPEIVPHAQFDDVMDVARQVGRGDCLEPGGPGFVWIAETCMQRRNNIGLDAREPAGLHAAHLLVVDDDGHVEGVSGPLWKATILSEVGVAQRSKILVSRMRSKLG